MPPFEGALFRMSGRLKSIVKHKILGLGKRVSCAKMGGLMLAICTLCDMFLCKELHVAMIAHALKFLVTQIFLIVINYFLTQ